MAPRQRKEHVEDSSSCDDVSTTALLLEERKNSRYKPTMPTTSTSMPTSKPLTLNITESDIARDNHDFFNLVALVGPPPIYARTVYWSVMLHICTGPYIRSYSFNRYLFLSPLSIFLACHMPPFDDSIYPILSFLEAVRPCCMRY